jgi:hypothetical protein
VHALFNAPPDLEDHPQRAVECAIAIKAWSEGFRRRDPAPRQSSSAARWRFIGQLGKEALAEMALVISFVILMFNVANGGLGGGVASSMARALGGGRLDDARAIVVHSLIFAVIFARLD